MGSGRLGECDIEEEIAKGNKRKQRDMKDSHRTMKEDGLDQRIPEIKQARDPTSCSEIDRAQYSHRQTSSDQPISSRCARAYTEPIPNVIQNTLHKIYNTTDPPALKLLKTLSSHTLYSASLRAYSPWRCLSRSLIKCLEIGEPSQYILQHYLRTVEDPRTFIRQLAPVAVEPLNPTTLSTLLQRLLRSCSQADLTEIRSKARGPLDWSIIIKAYLAMSDLPNCRKSTSCLIAGYDSSLSPLGRLRPTQTLYSLSNIAAQVINIHLKHDELHYAIAIYLQVSQIENSPLIRMAQLEILLYMGYKQEVFDHLKRLADTYACLWSSAIWKKLIAACLESGDSHMLSETQKYCLQIRTSSDRSYKHLRKLVLSHNESLYKDSLQYHFPAHLIPTYDISAGAMLIHSIRPSTRRTCGSRFAFGKLGQTIKRHNSPQELEYLIYKSRLNRRTRSLTQAVKAYYDGLMKSHSKWPERYAFSLSNNPFETHATLMIIRFCRHARELHHPNIAAFLDLLLRYRLKNRNSVDQYIGLLLKCLELLNLHLSLRRGTTKATRKIGMRFRSVRQKKPDCIPYLPQIQGTKLKDFKLQWLTHVGVHQIILLDSGRYGTKMTAVGLQEIAQFCRSRKWKMPQVIQTLQAYLVGSSKLSLLSALASKPALLRTSQPISFGGMTATVAELEAKMLATLEQPREQISCYA